MGGAKRLVKTATVNGKDSLSVAYKVTKNTTFTEVCSGDAWYYAASASALVKG